MNFSLAYNRFRNTILLFLTMVGTAMILLFVLASEVSAQTTLTPQPCVILTGAATCVGTADVSFSTTTPQPNFYQATLSYTINNRVYGDDINVTFGYGTNILQFRSGTQVLREISVPINCETGSIWNGQICAADVTVGMTQNCFIAYNQSTCTGQVRMTARGTVTNPNIYNQTTNTIVSNQLGTNVPVQLGYGRSILQARNGTQVLNEITAVTSCATSLVWNGRVCAPSAFDVISDIEIYGAGYGGPDNTCREFNLWACDTRANQPPVQLDFFIDGQLIHTATPNVYGAGMFGSPWWANIAQYRYMPACGDGGAANPQNLTRYSYSVPLQFKDNRDHMMQIRATRSDGRSRLVAFNGWNGYTGYPTSFPINCAPAPAPTCTLRASNLTPALGDTVSLTWTSRNASDNNAFIANDRSARTWNINPNNTTGSINVTPTTTTRYTLTLENIDGGATSSCSVLVRARNTATGRVSANDCVIPAGATTCATTVSWNITGASAPNVWNRARVVSAGSGASNTVSHRLTFGTNTLEARNGTTTVLATAAPKATCAGTSEWDGTRCALVPSLSATNCFIPVNQSTCLSDVRWFVPQSIVNPRVVNMTTNTIYASTSNFKRRYIGREVINFGPNNIQLRSGGQTLVSVSAAGQCAGANVWNGSVCARSASTTTPPTSSATPLVITLTPDATLVRRGQSTDISWTMSAVPTGYSCTLQGPGIANTVVTTRTGTIPSGALVSKSEYVLTCTAGATTVRGTTMIEVVASVQEV